MLRFQFYDVNLRCRWGFDPRWIFSENLSNGQTARFEFLHRYGSKIWINEKLGFESRSNLTKNE